MHLVETPKIDANGLKYFNSIVNTIARLIHTYYFYLDIYLKYSSPDIKQ